MLDTQETLYAALDDIWDELRPNDATDYEGALVDAQAFIEAVKQLQTNVKDADKEMAKALKNDFKVLESEADALARLLQDAI